MKAITTSLVLMNLLIFGLEVLLTQQFLSFNNAASQGMMYLWGVTPACITNAATCEGVTQLTLVTNIFLHGGLMHLVFNMIFLASIGGRGRRSDWQDKVCGTIFCSRNRRRTGADSMGTKQPYSNSGRERSNFRPNGSRVDIGS